MILEFSRLFFGIREGFKLVVDKILVVFNGLNFKSDIGVIIITVIGLNFVRILKLLFFFL